MRDIIQTQMLFLLLFIGINKIVAQDSITIPDYLKENTISIKRASDSLDDRTFGELKALFKQYLGNKEKSKVYADIYLIKAKKERDTVEISNGYDLLSRVGGETVELIYIDSIIRLTKSFEHQEYPAKAYLRKGSYYHLKYDYNNALENYLIAQKYAEDNPNPRLLLAIKNNMAVLKKAVGGKKDALHIFKENLESIKEQDTIHQYARAYITVLYNIADSYHRMSEPDSARYYVNKGLLKSYKHEEKYLYPTFLMLSGINNNLLGNHRSALDSLYKMEKLIKSDSGQNVNESICYIQIAKSLNKLDEEEKAFRYLKKVDSMIHPDNYTIETRDGFELLINYYERIGDTKNQLKTMSKLIQMDTLFQANNTNIKSDIIKKYDTAKLINERNKIINELQTDKKNAKYNLIILTAVIIVLMILSINYYRRQRIYKLRFTELLNQSKNQSEKLKQENKIIEIDLPDEIVEDILTKLKEFESKKGFLNPSIKMNDLAKKLNTNSSYFSKIINLYKNKNFANYVNDLRIDYCIERLKTDNKFRLYAIKYIGEEVGFNSVQSFSRAFYKRTGIYPSYFIKNINKNKVS